jgi:monoterpene epsilon-lactone hydrolase
LINLVVRKDISRVNDKLNTKKATYMASIQASLGKYFIRQLRNKSKSYADNLEVVRIEQDKALSRIRPPKNVQFETIAFENFTAEWTKKTNDTSFKYSDKVILYLHGGGYAVGSAASHRGLVGKIVADSSIKALSVNYRLAPEFPFPAGLDDSLIVYKWLIENGYKPKDIIIMGDSAGGGLALSTLLKIKSENLEQPLAAVVISPWTDLTLSGDTIVTHQEKEPLLLADQASKWAKWYYSSLDPKDPFISPLFGNYEGIAPILVHVGTDEILLSDSLRLISSAKKFGADIQVEIWEGMMHVFHFGWPYMPEARQAIIKITSFLESKINSYNYEKYGAENQLNVLSKTVAAKEEKSNSWLNLKNKIFRNFWGN